VVSTGWGQPGNIQSLERIRLPVQSDQFIGKPPVLHTVVQVYVANVEAFAQLQIYPELVALALQAGCIAILVEVQQMCAQTLRNRVFRNLVEGPLCEALLPSEDALHPAQRLQPWTLRHTAVEVE
jgi:hypothetical protein